MTNQQIVEKFIAGATAGKITRHNDYTGETHTPLFIEGDTLFSYGRHYPLARRVEGGIWVNSERYSATTSKHASLVRFCACRSNLSLV